MTNIQAIDLLKGLEQSLDDYCELNDEGKTVFRMAITALEVFGISEQLPSAQPERPTGRWVECDHDKWDIGIHALRCSECNRGYHLNNELTIYNWNYCPVCGAKMEVGHEQN